MLVTQFATLEQPGQDEIDVQAIDIDQPLDAVIADTVRHIQSFQPQEACA
jgi:gluconokinase